MNGQGRGNSVLRCAPIEGLDESVELSNKAPVRKQNIDRWKAMVQPAGVVTLLPAGTTVFLFLTSWPSSSL